MEPAVQAKIHNALKGIKAASLAGAWHTETKDASHGLGSMEKEASAKLAVDMDAMPHAPKRE